MTIANVNIGAAPNDGTGDTLRAAFTKVNANFSDFPYVVSNHLNAVDAALDCGQSPAIQIFGDATSDETNEFAYLLGTAIAARRPNVHVRYELWNNATQDYSAPVVINEGNGRTGIVFNASIVRRVEPAELVDITGNLDIRATASMASWTAPATVQALGGRLGGAGLKSYAISITTLGRIQLEWSVDGTATITNTSTVAVPFAGGAIGSVRATIEFAAGNYTTTFFTSTDNTTWTTLGTPSAGVGGSLFNPARMLEYGGRWAANFLTGTLFDFEVRQGVNGPITNPQPISTAYVNTDADTNTIIGGPMVTISNASFAGTDYAHWSDTARLAKAVRPYQLGIVIVNLGHNTSPVIGAVGVKALFDTFAAALEARAPTMSLIYMTQNPRTLASTGTVQTNANAHAWRQLMTAAVAQRRGWAIIDTMRVFYNDPRGLTNLIEPSLGTQPNVANGRPLLASVVSGAIAVGAR